MAPAVKEKPKTAKKRISTKKPNPRTPTIIKVKIPNLKAKAAASKTSPLLCSTEGATPTVNTGKNSNNASPDIPTQPCLEGATPKLSKLKNLGKNHSIQLANAAVATMQLIKTEKDLTTDVMVSIADEIIKSKPRKRKKIDSAKNSTEKIKRNRKMSVSKKVKVVKNIKVPKEEYASPVSTDPTGFKMTPPIKKAKRARKKKIAPIGKQEVKTKIFNEDLLNKLKNFGNSSPLNHQEDKTETKVNCEPKMEGKPCSPNLSTDNFSWIGDISSSNRSLSTDSRRLVVLDGKVPQILLVDCREMTEAEPISVRNSPEKENQDGSDDSLSTSKSLSLSSSSTEVSTQIEKGLEEVILKLNSLDLEFINWLGSEPTLDLQNKSFILKKETEAIKWCQLFRQGRFSNVTSSSGSEKAKTPEKSPLKAISEVNMTNDEKDDEAYCNDDDDVISLLAESISGIGSCRLSPVSFIAPTRPKFPTFRKEVQQEKTSEVPKSVCEKKNADSTVNRDSDKTVEPSMIAHMYSAMIPIKSVILHGVCFFNLVSVCKKNICVYPHDELPLPTILSRLCSANEPLLISEYLLVRKYPQLREKYMALYAAEFCRRNTTRVLVEVALDSCKMNQVVKTKVLEATLENFNLKGFQGCEDLLTKKGYPPSGRLCDELMKAVADTQNFGRFKNVFIQLVEFITGLGFTFDSVVAGRILERICIFPFEESLNRALILLLKNTDGSIFGNICIAELEERLATSSVELYEDFMRFKRSVVGETAPAQVSTDKVTKIAQNVEKERHTSPDTTQLERYKIDIPKITRTIDTSKNIRTSIIKPPVLATVPNYPPPITNNIRFRPSLRPMRGQMFGQVWSQGYGNHSRMQFRHHFPRGYRGGRGSANYQRRPRHDFY